MYFPISGATIDPFYLVGLGFVVGILGGFFGVGGSFLAGPALFAAGVPMNFVVGTDLIHIVGKSIVAARKHWTLGSIDLRLAGIMVIGTIAGIQVGVEGIELLKKAGRVDLVVGVVAIIVYTCISLFVAYESWQSLKIPQGKKNTGGSPAARKDKLFFKNFATWIQRLPLGPMVSLPFSGIKSISIGAILLISFVGGAFSSFLGGGAGFDGLSPGHPDAHRGGDRSFRNRRLREHRFLRARGEGQCRYFHRADHADGRSGRRADRCNADPVFQRAAHPAGVRAAAAARRGPDRLRAVDGTSLQVVSGRGNRAIVAAWNFLRLIFGARRWS
jgi:uncharacterized membrane protein YfcA